MKHLAIKSLDKGRSYLTVPLDCIQEQNTGNTKEENQDAIAKRMWKEFIDNNKTHQTVNGNYGLTLTPTFSFVFSIPLSFAHFGRLLFSSPFSTSIA